MLLSLNTYAVMMTCEIKYNTETITKRHFDLKNDQKVYVGNIDAQKFFLKRTRNYLYEIEIFNPMVPSRNYAQASIKHFDESLAWANWSRESIQSIRCFLIRPLKH